MWLVPVVVLVLLLWLFLLRTKAAPNAPAQPAQQPGPIQAAEPQSASDGAASTPDQKWRQSNQQALKQAARGDWDSYACTLQDQGDQLFDEGKRLRAIDTYSRVLFVQINGPRDAEPFTGKGFVTGQVYDRVRECAADAGLDAAGTRSKFIDAAGKIYDAAMPMDPAQAWDAISANRAKMAEEDRAKREARNKARREAKKPT